ncbi:MAG: HDOD domain-containing protein [Deltaproteobacteria bacterium]|nr:HDOD domain-containing protein [Deltaproteobacteria bacterium]
MNGRVPLPSLSDIKKVLTFHRRELPSFPQVSAKLLEMTSDETASLEDISKVVGSEPGIAAKVLEIVNGGIGLTPVTAIYCSFRIQGRRNLFPRGLRL